MTQAQDDDIKIIDLIGSGSFGKVYIGEHNFIDVAIKEVEINNEELIDQLYREVDVIKNLRHLNLISYYGLSIGDAKVGIIMELCKGGSVFSLLHNKCKVFSVKQKLKILFDTAAGLYYLHSQQPPIMHRSLKSSNVLIVEDNINDNSTITIKLTDYGFSRRTLECKGKKTPDYDSSLWTAPEVLKGEEHERKSDVYSFGVLMWEVFAEHIPYFESGYNNYNVLNMQVAYNNIRPNINLLPKETPKEIVNLITQCWDENSCKRPSMKEVTGILKSLLK